MASLKDTNPIKSIRKDSFNLRDDDFHEELLDEQIRSKKDIFQPVSSIDVQIQLRRDNDQHNKENYEEPKQPFQRSFTSVIDDDQYNAKVGTIRQMKPKLKDGLCNKAEYIFGSSNSSHINLYPTFESVPDEFDGNEGGIGALLPNHNFVNRNDLALPRPAIVPNLRNSRDYFWDVNDGTISEREFNKREKLQLENQKSIPFVISDGNLYSHQKEIEGIASSYVNIPNIPKSLLLDGSKPCNPSDEKVKEAKDNVERLQIESSGVSSSERNSSTYKKSKSSSDTPNDNKLSKKSSSETPKDKKSSNDSPNDKKSSPENPKDKKSSPENPKDNNSSSDLSKDKKDDDQENLKKSNYSSISNAKTPKSSFGRENDKLLSHNGSSEFLKDNKDVLNINDKSKQTFKGIDNIANENNPSDISGGTIDQIEKKIKLTFSGLRAPFEMNSHKQINNKNVQMVNSPKFVSTNNLDSQNRVSNIRDSNEADSDEGYFTTLWRNVTK